MENNIKIRPLSILISTLFISLFGGIWYGLLFSDIQQASHRFTAEEYADSNPAWYVGGLVISWLITWGIGQIIKQQGVPGTKAGIKGAIKAIIGFGLPLISYPLVFSPLHDLTLYAVGLFQIIISWTIAGAILGAMSKEVPETT